MRTVQYELLRPHEILEEKARKSIVYLPIGPLEWHGPAMPYGTDPLMAKAVTRKAAIQTGGVVMPTLYIGTERERPPEMIEAMGFENRNEYIIGMDMPKNSMKSFYMREEIFSIIVREYLRLLVMQEYKLIVIVNGHGAYNQISTLERLAIEFTNETKSRIIVRIPFAMADPDDEDMGHGTRLETSLQMYLNPDSVDLSQFPPGINKLKNSDWGIVDNCTFNLHPNDDKTVIHDPRTATAELGRRNVESSINYLVQQVEEEWNLQLTIVKGDGR